MERKCPKFGKNVFIAPGAVVIGDVMMGEESSVWYHCTVRGDDAAITIGSRTNIQDNVVLHVDEGMPLQIGDDCSIGHSAVLHGCRIGNNTLVGMGAIILNGARIGDDCIIAAGALVTQNVEIPDRSLVMGSPGKAVRSLTEEEIKANLENARSYVLHSRAYKSEE